MNGQNCVRDKWTGRQCSEEQFLARDIERQPAGTRASSGTGRRKHCRQCSPFTCYMMGGAVEQIPHNSDNIQ